jgi:hypothetical protein
MNAVLSSVAFIAWTTHLLEEEPDDQPLTQAGITAFRLVYISTMENVSTHIQTLVPHVHTFFQSIN